MRHRLERGKLSSISTCSLSEGSVRTLLCNIWCCVAFVIFCLVTIRTEASTALRLPRRMASSSTGSTVDSLTCSIDKLAPEVADDGDDPFQSKTANEEVVGEPDEADGELNILEKCARHEEFLAYSICADLEDIDILHLCQANRTLYAIFSPVLGRRLRRLLKKFITGRQDRSCHIHIHSIPCDDEAAVDNPDYEFWCKDNISLIRGLPAWRTLWRRQLRNTCVGDFFWVFRGRSTAMAGPRTATYPIKDYDIRLVAIYEAIIPEDRQPPELSLVTTIAACGVRCLMLASHNGQRILGGRSVVLKPSPSIYEIDPVFALTRHRPEDRGGLDVQVRREEM